MIQHYDDSTIQKLLDNDPHYNIGKFGTLPRKSKYGSKEAEQCGLIPLLDMPQELVQVADFKAVIDECHAKQIFAMYHQKNSGVLDSTGGKWNQDGFGYCATADTEVLTTKGWVPYPDYDWISPLATVNTRTHAMEFQAPFEKHVYDYEGPMIYSSNRRIDFGVTPDHQMYLRKWDESKRALSDKYSFVRAGDIGWYAGLLHAPSGQIGTEVVEVEVPGDRKYSGDDFVALLGIIVSDGYAGGSDSTKNWVSFASFRDELREDVYSLAHRTGFVEKESHPGVWCRYSAKSFASWVRETCYVDGKTGARNKKVPDIIKTLSVRQIKIFLHWFNDRSRSGHQFYNSSKRLIDDLQELHLRIGKRSTISKHKAREVPFRGKVIHSGEGYTLTVGSDDTLSIDKKKHIETEYYKGPVYCAAVPNHTLLTRRNGSVLISSNCWAYGLTMSVMDCRAVEGQTPIRLSPFSLGWLVGWRDQGFYLDEAIKGANERGIAPVEYVPEYELNTSKFKAGWEREALKYRPIEWWDTKRSNGTVSMIQQCITILRTGRPLYVAFNYWSHALQTVGVLWDETQPNNVRWVLRNSHNEPDFITLAGSKGIPDEAYGVRLVSRPD